MKNFSRILKKGSKSNSGITLISLVVTIIVLLILASVATYSGIEAIENTEMTTFTAELKIMQTYVNQLYDKYSEGGSVIITIDGATTTYTGNDTTNGIQEIGRTVNVDTNSNEKDEVAVAALEGAGITETDGFKLYDNDIKEALGIEGVNQSVLVNVATRQIVSYRGLEYKNEMYYTLEQVPDGFYNVDYNSSNSVTSFDVKATTITGNKWEITVSNIQSEGYVDKWYVKYSKDGGETHTSENLSFEVSESGDWVVQVYNDNVESVAQTVTCEDVIPTSWVRTTESDSEWYSYSGKNVNTPKLKGNMTPIKYSGTWADGASTTNKWANAMTSDGSMFVWIPRFAYKITYYTDEKKTTVSSEKTRYGTIDVAFVDIVNNFLNSEDSGDITTNVEADGAGTDIWLVHPAFVNNVDNGGWDSELSGIWVGKFETTGTYDSTDASNTVISVKPGVSSLRSLTINTMYKTALSATFSETATINSHMAKNSEWGATVYLAISEYGTKGSDVTKNSSSSYYTGGTSEQVDIYTLNYSQSTTNNPYGVYDLKGGAYERVASYVNYGSNSSNLSTYGGTSTGDLYGSTESEQSTSTRYKTVYTASSTSQSASYNLLGTAGTIKKGDAVYETSTSYTGTTSWNPSTGNTVGSNFPATGGPFFSRGGNYNSSYPGVFYFTYYDGSGYSYDRFPCGACVLAL